MESLHTLKSRISAVKNIGQITKAMEVVVATKMRRAQEVLLASRPYAFKALEVLGALTHGAPIETVYTTARPVAHTLLVIVASDRGLTGAFNSQVFRAADQFLASDPIPANSGHRVLLMLIGKKAIRYGEKKGLAIAERFSGFGDYAEPNQIQPAADLVLDGFRAGRWDRVLTVSTHFRTALKQDTLVRQILPVDVERIRETVREIVPEHGRYAEFALRMRLDNAHTRADYLFEPSAAAVLESLFPHLVTMQLYHLILEANASEHSARRVAMKNASDNAAELSGTLTVHYHKARQASITKELVEITATQSARG